MNDVCLCGGSTRTVLFGSSDGNYEIVLCDICSQVRVLRVGDKPKKRVYEKEDLTVYIQKPELFRSLFRRVLENISRYKNHGKLLDIGAGVGLLVSEAQKMGFDATGIEPSKDGVRFAQKEFGVQLHHGTFPSKDIKGTFDCIVLNHVLEHVDDPHALIRAAFRQLSPHGILVIGVPNFGCLLAQMKRARWQSLIPDQHRWQFTKLTLHNLVTAHGFDVLGIFTDNHDRSMHYIWKKPLYALLDLWTRWTTNGEAILVIYKKL